MSRLEELINELCPEGVKYKKLKKFLNIGEALSLNHIQIKIFMVDQNQCHLFKLQIC